jgi:hypothetical protein
MKQITISKIRSFLYTIAKILGDVNAVKRNKIGTRATNRVTGKVSTRLKSYLSRKIMSIFK